ncbi:MAG: Lrp/AsnC family transcriptional regulator [Spirochaetota bacterium]
MCPDEADWKIIEIMRKGREHYNTIAKKLNVSEGMVRQRVRRLKEANILIERALINPDVLDNQLVALVAVNISVSRLLEEKAREISELENVLSVSITSGRYDLLVEVLVDSNKGLVHFITEELSRVEGIAKTECFLLLKSYGKYV